MSNCIQLRSMQQLQELQQQNKPFCIKVGATWCNPCKTYKPTFHKVAEDNQNRFVFAECDADDFADFCDMYNVRAVPTTLFLNANGEIVDSYTGNMPVNSLQEVVDKTYSKCI